MHIYGKLEGHEKQRLDFRSDFNFVNLVNPTTRETLITQTHCPW